jgi:hypothetical protein
VYDIFWTRWKKVPLMLCGVGFPSPNVSSEVIGTYPKIWTIYLYVTLPDNTVTRSEIYIGKPLQASVSLHATDDASVAALDAVSDMNLRELFIVSRCLVDADEEDDAAAQGTGSNFPGLKISVSEAPGSKCPRCWMHSVVTDPETDLCPRCAAVVAAL